MPVWYEATKKYVEQGRLQLVGVIQEQHADRCRLLSQWHQWDWPILHDPINALQTTAVPILVALDEHGIVRSVRPNLETFQQEFLDRTFADDASDAGPALTPPLDLNRIASQDHQRRGDCLALWHRKEQLDEAITAYRAAIEQSPRQAVNHFRLGVCLLERFEQSSRDPVDFQDAVAAWEQALQLQPNQYIWRRRIQQYGPRLDKPYPFYDWVREAEASIRARGEVPIELRVRPAGAELASPGKTAASSTAAASNPDPQGRITRDQQSLIKTSVSLVPSRPRAGSTLRLHVHFVPNAATKTHWNNESDPLVMWIESDDAVTVQPQLVKSEPVRAAESSEVRRLDTEVTLPADAQGTVKLNAYALYYVCEDIGGVCQYLRQDIPIEIRLDDSPRGQ